LEQADATSADVPRASGEPGSPIVIICTLFDRKSNQNVSVFFVLKGGKIHREPGADESFGE